VLLALSGFLFEVRYRAQSVAPIVTDDVACAGRSS
jgi:hypothetical protein